MPGSPGGGAPGSPRPPTNGVGEGSPASVRTDAAAELERLSKAGQSQKSEEENFSQS